MKKTSENSSHLDTSSLFEENKWADWLTQNGRYLAYGLLALIVVLIIGYRFTASRTVISENDYLNAETDFQFFQSTVGNKDEAASEEALKKLNALLQRHPELQVKYQGAIAQALISAGMAAQAQPFAEPAIARTKDENSPFYTDYSQTTLLIGNEQFAPALERALALKQKMEQSREASSSMKEQASDYLYLTNFVRIGMLQQQLGLAEQEKQTWKEWHQVTSALTNPADLMAQLNLLSVGNVSFVNYLAERERQLNLPSK